MPVYGARGDMARCPAVNADKGETFRAADAFAFNENFLPRTDQIFQVAAIGRITGRS